MQQGQKIVLVTAGTLGDVYPFISLAKALVLEGFDPIVATYPCHIDHVERAGIAAHPVGPDLPEILSSLGVGLDDFVDRMAADRSFFPAKIVLPHLQANLDALRTVIEGAAMVVTHVAAPAAVIAAQVYRVPHVTVLFSPFLALSAHDPPVIPPIPFLPVPQSRAAIMWNRIFISLFQHALAHLARPVAQMRRELDLPGPTLDNFSIFGPKSGAVRVLGLYSPLLSDVQPDHPDGFEVVGSSNYDGPITGELNSSLRAFLDEGDAPIIFTMGSLSLGGSPFHEICIKASRQTGHRALLLVPDAEVAGLSNLIAPDVHIAGYIPHSLLLPHARLIVHHGGIGTATQALRAGLPQLVVPHCNDQFDNAARLERMGVAQSLPLKHFQTKRVAAALEVLLATPEIALRATELVEVIYREDGAAQAAKKIAEALLIASEDCARHSANTKLV